MASTRSTASDARRHSQYRFSFSWESPYGRVVGLVERIRPRAGLALDFGCGFSAIAEPLVERGFQYLGVDRDAAALAEVSERGHEVHALDLNTGEFAADLERIVGERPIGAMFALDVIEHLLEPGAFLATLRNLLGRHGSAPLILSVPNVAHADVGAKLVFGRWDYTRTGLLDHTHVNFFTADRLQAVTRESGFMEVLAADWTAADSDQRFPAEHPALCKDSPVAQQLRTWRDTADPHGSTIQFVRAFLPVDIDAGPGLISHDRSASQASTRRLTVIMRTQGRRVLNLREALTCLAAQTVDTFDVRVMVHADSDGTLSTVNRIVSEFHPTFKSRVAVIQIAAGGGRSRPLNAGLEGIQSEYVAFLDDDDLVTADWAEAFCSGANGSAIVRSESAARCIAAAADPAAPYFVTSGLDFRFAAGFDLAQHLWQNQTPICAYAVPVSLIKTFALRFDEEFVVLEDWEFLLRCVSLAAVRDTGQLTSIVQLWTGGDSSRSVHSEMLWKSLERILQERLNTRPVLLPAGAVAQLVEVHRRSADLEAEMRAVRTRIEDLESTEAEAARAREALGDLDHRYNVLVHSKRWRVLGPPARAVEMVRRWRRNRVVG